MANKEICRIQRPFDIDMATDHVIGTEIHDRLNPTEMNKCEKILDSMNILIHKFFNMYNI